MLGQMWKCGLSGFKKVYKVKEKYCDVIICDFVFNYNFRKICAWQSQNIFTNINSRSQF